MRRPFRLRSTPDDDANERRSEAASLGFTGPTRDNYADRAVPLPCVAGDKEEEDDTEFGDQ